MLKSILENYIKNVSPKVNMKGEKEIAERYLGYVKEFEKQFQKAN